ncbi:MAG: MbnH family di-heme enzyme [Myxococcota bacterium]
MIAKRPAQSGLHITLQYTFVFALLCTGLGCVADSSERAPLTREELRRLLGVPDHFLLPAIPEFNPPTAEKIELGRHLFFDPALSGNGTQSCASCHDPAHAFADGLVRPVGSTGQSLLRNSQGLANVAYSASLTWANKDLHTLEAQIRVPLTSDMPVELGLTDGVRAEVVARFDADPDYQRLFERAFPRSEPGATLNKVILALADFLRTMVSGASAYDRYLNGDPDALSERQIEGLRLFNGEKFECHHCHGGINFTTSYADERLDESTSINPFFNNGLYNVDGTGGYPQGNQGLYDLTFDPDHRGLFRPPGLRNVERTAPYMHDGSISTLRGVVAHYVAGGRHIEEGAFAGDGRISPLKSGLIRPIDATEEEITSLVAFLTALTDEHFITSPQLQNPFECVDGSCLGQGKDAPAPDASPSLPLGPEDAFAQEGCEAFDAAEPPTLEAASAIDEAPSVALALRQVQQVQVENEGFVTLRIDRAHHDWALFSDEDLTIQSPDGLFTVHYLAGACPEQRIVDRRAHIHDEGDYLLILRGSGTFRVFTTHNASDHAG